MSIAHWHVCDNNSCGEINTNHPDDGTPAGWFLVARMDRAGGWNEEREWHFCSLRCLSKTRWDESECAPRG